MTLAASAAVAKEVEDARRHLSSRWYGVVLAEMEVVVMGVSKYVGDDERQLLVRSL